MSDENEKKGFKFPTAYTILFLLIILVAIGTWFIPAGQYDLNEDGEPIPGTYHQVESNPQRILTDGLAAPINGLYGIEDETGFVNVYNSGDLFGAIDVALFVLVIGGFLGITMKTGAIDAGIGSITQAMQGREKWMIAILMIVFALGGTTYGMAEETLAFYVLIVAVMIATGYDSLTGVAVIMLGAGIGVLGSTINPFATGDCRHYLCHPLRRKGQKGPIQVAGLRPKGRKRKIFPEGFEQRGGPRVYGSA
jgi:uncharacterized ion transporter superfamily protein YfcC